MYPRLEELTPTDDEELRALWQRTAEAALKDRRVGMERRCRCRLNSWCW